ncbi:hypothetical protein HHK36_025239 [Tetracentron sinense]|uniref:Uncharacterized protein n=1 Tax=Tetracentron sinense TaxID=13715 RepID=A0A834YRI8_TETSI|nr:hypothetical protein HHK36_025239 [Tetracentron sinense]
MKYQIKEALISVLVVMFVISSTCAISDAPFMVAHKKVSLTRLKSGAERLSVLMDIYNRGSATAYDVSLTDDSWAQDVFDLVIGNTSKSWERLDAGSLVSHSFELESKVKGLFYSAPAVITFRIPTKAVLQEAYSTPILPLDILADKAPEKKFEWVSKEVVGKIWVHGLRGLHHGSVRVFNCHPVEIHFFQGNQEEALSTLQTGNRSRSLSLIGLLFQGKGMPLSIASQIVFSSESRTCPNF